MDLADHGDPPVGQAFDEVHLPQRTAAIQWGTGDFADRLVEFTAATGGGHPPRPDVILEVDLGMLPPHGVVELERDVDELIAERLQLVQAFAEHAAELVDAERAVAQAGEVDDGNLEGVHVHVGRFRIQQERVPPTQSFHSTSPALRVRTSAGRSV